MLIYCYMNANILKTSEYLWMYIRVGVEEISILFFYYFSGLITHFNNAKVLFYNIKHQHRKFV